LSSASHNFHKKYEEIDLSVIRYIVMKSVAEI